MCVPQGTVLGPILFLMYINQLCDLGTNGKVISFADDTVLLFDDSSWESCFGLASSGITTVKNWLDNRKLSLNTIKTKYMTFSLNKAGQPNNGRVFIHKDNCIGVNCNDECTGLESVGQVKYLGVMVDYQLKWDVHLTQLVARCRKLIYMFAILRTFLQPSILKTVYHALAQSIFQYGIICFGSTYNNIINPLGNNTKENYNAKRQPLPDRSVFP